MTEATPPIEGLTQVELVRAGHHVSVARAVRDDREVALKWAQDEQGDALIAWEASRIAELGRQGLPTCLARGRCGAREYLLSAWVPGSALGLLSRTPAARALLDADTAAALAAAMAHVVAPLHRRQPPLIHCDLNAENFILQPDGRLALIDFGAAQPLGVEAPEQVSAARPRFVPEFPIGVPIDTCFDIYMIGATLYELLCGKVPFPMFPATFDEQEAYQRRLRRRVAPLGELRPDLPPELALAVDAALRPLHPSRVALDSCPLPARVASLDAFTALMPRSATRDRLRSLASRLAQLRRTPA